MKNILLKIARWINKKYGVKVKLEDRFSFRGKLYCIVDITLKQEIGCLDELTITSHDVSVVQKNRIN